MRALITGVAIILGALSSAAMAEPAGLPTKTFALKWVALPVGRFVQDETAAASSIVSLPALAIDTLDPRVLDEAFTSAGDNAERRGLMLDDMMANADQPVRTALQRLRDAERDYGVAASAASYPGPDDAFVAMVTRVTDGSGRSVALGSGDQEAALDAAYAKASSAADGPTQAAIAAAQASWTRYRDAFSAYAETVKPGSAPAVRAELAQRRIVDLTR